MKRPVTLLLLVVLIALPVSNLSAAMQASDGRTIGQLNLIPAPVLKRYISPKFYRTLLVSPVKGWVVVRGKLVGTRISGARIVHSELDGRFDALALERAKDVQLAGAFSVDSRMGSSILMHLLIYQIADGTMALSFPHLDTPGGNQQKYFGCTKLTVLKADGTWTEIEGPPSLHNQGWAVRTPGLENNIRAMLKLERIPGGK